MANQTYDQTASIMTTDAWTGARVLAYLFDSAPYDRTHKMLSEVLAAGAVQRNVTEIQNRSTGATGECKGLPAMFTVTPKGSPLQVVLAWDKNLPDMEVLAFYDEDENGDELALLNNGTFIVRPTDFDQATGVGTWFTL